MKITNNAHIKKNGSISIAICSWNGYWKKFGEKISKNINSFNTQPDEIVIVSDEDIDTSLINCKNIKVIKVVENIFGKKINQYRRMAVKNCSSEWIVPLDLDDNQLPNYLDNLDITADIHAFAFLDKTDNTKYFPDKTSLEKRLNRITDSSLIPGTSAIKRKVFDKIQYEPNCYEDLVFFAYAAKLNLKVSYDNNIRFEYSGFHADKNGAEINRVSNIHIDMIKGNRNLYVYWDSNSEITSNRTACLQSIKDFSAVNVIVIDDNKFYTYNNPEIPIHKGFKYLSSVGKSEYVRAYMMYFYGNGYSDIKKCEFDWNPYFDKLMLSYNSCIGYEPKAATDIGNFWHDNMGILKNVRIHYKKFMGMGYFIFKPKTELAFRYLLEVHRRMDISYDTLEKNPGVHPYIVPGGLHKSYTGSLSLTTENKNYPFSWAELGGISMHKAQYENGLKGFDGSMPHINMKDYR